ncbi:MAG: histidinol dehydrogenase [Solirubrobacteraceae bacterium]|nr:histidinol dehydrogenase [Solirubrobacteraceae bacterium]
MRPEDLRARVPTGESVAEAVREIIADVRARGDTAVAELEARFAVPHAEGPVPDAALRTAYDNVYAVARASVVGDREVELPQGHRVRVREVPVHRAGIYAPGGQAPYPSSVIMGVATARAAGVEEVVVCASHPIMRAAAFAADEVHAMGGAHAIAALAYGTETIKPVDVIVGPGSLYAQEAKRQVAHVVGIDGFAGPSDLLIIASEPSGLVRLDALAQAEHGPGTIVAVLSPDPTVLRGLEAPIVPIPVDSLEDALAFSEAFAPEHLQLVGADAEALAPRVTRAGAVFVGTGTAFGDYVAGSNHVLPTEGAARFASGLNVRHFLRVMNEVHIPPGAAAQLAAAGVAIAEAEGFGAHAASMAARMDAP